MKLYSVELTKVIVVEVEETSPARAMKEAELQSECMNHEQSWAEAELQCKVIAEEEIKP